MPRPVTPYSSVLGDREPVATMQEAIDRTGGVTAGWTPDRWERSLAPGKWCARQIVIHLAQTELALGTRVRFALATPGYVAQNFSQDDWMVRESRAGAREAVDAFVAVGRLNCALFASLSPDDRGVPFSHPEYGMLTVDWVIHQIAGHQLHHLQQLEQIARTSW